MRMLQPFGGGKLKQVQLYLSVAEARELAGELTKLLGDPEGAEHCHLFAKDGGGELSVSIVTRTKLANGAYTAEELATFGQWHPEP